MRWCILLLLPLLGILAPHPATGQNVPALEVTLAEKDRTYHAQQMRLTLAREHVPQLEGEIRLAQDEITTRRQHLKMTQQQLQQKMGLFLSNPRLSLEPEQQAYTATRDAVEAGEQTVTTAAHPGAA